MSAPATPTSANVAFLRIPQFATLPVSEQASLKERLEGRARSAIAGLAPDERAMLDADDGLAIVLFCEPARALDIAQALHGSAPEAPLQAGLNYGPLALTSRGGDARVFGDGLSAAAAAARFASPERLLVTHDFAKALRSRDPARAADLATAGDFTDTRVRLHSFYTPDPAARLAAPPAPARLRHRRRGGESSFSASPAARRAPGSSRRCPRW